MCERTRTYAGVGGLRHLHQSEEQVAQIQAVRRGRAKRLGRTPPRRSRNLMEVDNLGSLFLPARGG
jgi:hypothetical protein